MLYDWHNYGKSTIGARSDIENVRIENLQAFYRMYYQPDNAVLIVAGKFDEAKTLRWIADAFGKHPEAEADLCRCCGPSEPTHDGERQFTSGARARCRSSGRVSHPDVAAVRELLPIGLRRRHPRRHAERPAAQGAGRKRQGVAGLRLSASARRIPVLFMFGAVVKKGEPLEPVAPDDDRGHRRDLVRQDSPRPKRR